MNVFDSLTSADEQVGPAEEKKVRLRASQACEVCRVRKRKVSCELVSIGAPANWYPQCTGEKPVCGRCKDRNLKCIWSDVVPHRQQRPRTKRIPNLSPLKITDHSDSSSTRSSRSSTHSVRRERRTADQYRREASSPSSIPPLSAGSDTASVVSSDNSQMSWENIPDVFYTVKDMTPEIAGPCDNGNQKFDWVGATLPPTDFETNALINFPLMSLDNSLGQYYNPPNLSDLSLPPSAYSKLDTLPSVFDSSSSASSTSSDYSQDILQQVTPSAVPNISMPSPIPVENLVSCPAWLEMLDPVVGSFLNPAPMLDDLSNFSAEPAKDPQPFLHRYKSVESQVFS